MADVIVTDDGDQGPADSAHEAAVAEGQSQAHAEQASQAAAEAQTAADMANSALESQARITSEAVEAAETARSEAEKTQATSVALYELMQQQNATLQALAAKLLADPEPAPEPEPEPEAETENAPESDEPPAQEQHWYYRKMGKHLCMSTSALWNF